MTVITELKVRIRPRWWLTHALTAIGVAAPVLGPRAAGRLASAAIDRGIITEAIT